MAENHASYREVTEAEATDAGLPEQPDTTYREEDGRTVAYNVGTRCFWKLGCSTFGAEPGESRAKSPIGRAVEQAQATLEEAIEAEGGKVLCAVMIVHAEGLTPSGGIDVQADSDDGPRDPEDILAFALSGVEQLAGRYGKPFAVFNAPVGGQG
jgi:hypothetical protein